MHVLRLGRGWELFSCRCCSWAGLMARSSKVRLLRSGPSGRCCTALLTELLSDGGICVRRNLGSGTLPGSHMPWTRCEVQKQQTAAWSQAGRGRAQVQVHARPSGNRWRTQGGNARTMLSGLWSTWPESAAHSSPAAEASASRVYPGEGSPLPSATRTGLPLQLSRMCWPASGG